MLLSALLTLSVTGLADDVQKLASRRVFFGHQSVGANIVDGVNDVTSGKLPVHEGRTPAPGLVHTLVGQNESPLSKLADFEAALGTLGGQADIALFKFCYVDFAANTDVEQLFADYLALHQRLRAKYPSITFVHVTVPLTVVPQGPMAWLKKTVSRKEPWGTRENEVRHRFNTLLRERLAGQPLFDLAALEATRPDGTAATWQRDGRTLPMLVAEYSGDGQHLNSVGRRRVAEALLTFLARLP